jgi:quercetin dioxygenase-like cupin family protein
VEEGTVDKPRFGRPIHAGEGDAIWFNGSLVMVKVAGADTQDAFDLVETIARGGNATPLHIDPSCETFHLLEGKVRFHVAGQEHTAVAGDTVVLPRGVPHAFKVTSDNARFLVLNVPGGHDRFFRAAGVPALTPELPPPGPPDMERMKTAARQSGIEILGPPPFAAAARENR